jgi:GntR family transcriptional regulator/MocR family aminotransferase
MATEAYGQPSHRALASAAGLAIKPLPVDARGAAISELGDADAVLLTPAHQFPLGVTLAAPRRTAAIAWAQHHARLIVEDDYDGEFRYDRQPVGAMQALAPEHVVYIGTASKTLAPGLRLGWLVVSSHLIDEIVAVKTLADRQTSALDQLTMAEFITRGAYDRHVRRSRLAYRRRRDRLVAELQRQVPSVRVTGIAAGLHALLELPEGRTEDEIVARASRRHGLAIEGLSSYRSTGQEHGPALVVGYGTPPPHALTDAIARLCAVLADRPSG